MFKRMLACTMCILLLVGLSCQSFTASARAATTTFSLTANDGKVGDTVTVSVSLSADSYFTNCTFYVHYDSSAVSYIEDTETPGPISPSTAMLYVKDHTAQQYVKGAYVAVNGIKKSGVLLTLDFKVLQEAAAEFSISFDECVGVDENDSEFDVSYQTVPCTINPHATKPVVTTTTAKTNATTAVKNTTTAASPKTTAGGNVTTTRGGNATTAAASTTVPTDKQGNTVATTPTTAATDAQGAVIVQPTNADPSNGSTAADATATKADKDLATDSDAATAPSALGVILVVLVCVLIAAGIAVAAVVARKKRVAPAEDTTQETATSDAVIDDATKETEIPSTNDEE